MQDNFLYPLSYIDADLRQDCRSRILNILQHFLKLRTIIVRTSLMRVFILMDNVITMLPSIFTSSFTLLLNRRLVLYSNIYGTNLKRGTECEYFAIVHASFVMVRDYEISLQAPDHD